MRLLATASPAKRVALLGEPVSVMLRALASASIPHVVIGDVAAVARGAPRDRARLEVCYAPDTAISARLSELLADWNARPLNVPDELPFVLDEQIVGDSPVLALATRHGEIVLRQAPDFATLADSSDLLDLGAAHTLVLSVESLTAALRATRCPVPASAIAGLEAVAALSNCVDLRP